MYMFLDSVLRCLTVVCGMRVREPSGVRLHKFVNITSNHKISHTMITQKTPTPCLTRKIWRLAHVKKTSSYYDIKESLQW